MPHQEINSATKVWPAAADGVSISPAGGWSSSSYVQLTASTSSAAYLAGIALSNGAVDTVEVDIATGGAGSETVICTFKTRIVGTTGDTEAFLLPIPIDNVGNGVRISARMRANAGGGTWRVAAFYIDKPATGSFLSTTKAQKVTSPSALGPTLVSGSGWANGSWLEMIASTSAAIVLSGFMASTETAWNEEIDVGVGSAGAESVVYTFAYTANLSSRVSHISFMSPFDNIGNGVRVAIRGRSSSGGGSRSYLTYYEKPL
jgi:hypothetical protein